MNNLTIKVEHTPKRCEVCHKEDLFDGKSNVCLRCKEYNPAQPQIVNEDKLLPANTTTIEKNSCMDIVDRLSDYLFCLSLLVTLMVLATLRMQELPNAMSWWSYLLGFNLIITFIAAIGHANQKVHKKTIVKLIGITLIPALPLLCFLLIIVWLSRLGIC